MTSVPALASLPLLVPAAREPVLSLIPVIADEFVLSFLLALVLLESYEYAEKRYDLAPYFLPIWGVASAAFGVYLLVVETGRIWARWLFLFAGIVAVGFWAYRRLFDRSLASER